MILLHGLGTLPPNRDAGDWDRTAVDSDLGGHAILQADGDWATKTRNGEPAHSRSVLHAVPDQTTSPGRSAAHPCASIPTVPAAAINLYSSSMVDALTTAAEDNEVQSMSIGTILSVPVS